MFFRNTLLEALVNAYEQSRVPPGLAWGKMLNKMHTFTDRILVTLLETVSGIRGGTFMSGKNLNVLRHRL